MDFKYSKDKIWLENEDGNIIAVIEFPEVEDGLVNITHTEVDSSLQGQGIASKLTKACADYLRENNKKAKLSCSYAIRWFNKNNEYEDILFDKEEVKKQANELLGPACGIKK